MEATPFIEQHPLGALEDDRARREQPRQVAVTGQRHPAGDGVVDGREVSGRREGGGARQFVGEPVTQPGELGDQGAGARDVTDPRGVLREIERVPRRLADAHAARAVPALAARFFPRAVGGAVVGGGEQRARVDREQAERVGDAEAGEALRLGDQGEEVDEHEPGQERPGPRGEGARAELGERVRLAARAEHVVRRLRTAVEPDDGLDRAAPVICGVSRVPCALRAQPVHDRPLARVAVAEVYDDDMALHSSTLPAGKSWLEPLARAAGRARGAGAGRRAR